MAYGAQNHALVKFIENSIPRSTTTNPPANIAQLLSRVKMVQIKSTSVIFIPTNNASHVHFVLGYALQMLLANTFVAT